MRKVLKKLLVTTLLIASTSYADMNNYVYDSNSLVGFETGFSSFDVKDANNVTTKEKFEYVGMKIGAETHNVRMFLSLRNAFVDNYNYAYMYGAELQYKFNLSSIINFYIGANIGRISFRFDDASNNTRDFTTEYMGGDVGFNWHLTDSADIEIGARIMSLPEPEHTLSGVTYTFDDISMSYVSLIFKYQMD